MNVDVKFPTDYNAYEIVTDYGTITVPVESFHTPRSFFLKELTEKILSCVETAKESV